MLGGYKKCVLGLDNDGVFTPITFPDGTSINERETSRRISSIRKKILPVCKIIGQNYTDQELFEIINSFRGDYMKDFTVLQDILDKHNLATSIISKVGYNHGPITIPDIIINNKDKFKQLILAPCNSPEIDMLANPKIARNSNKTGSLFYWFYNSLNDIKKKKTEVGANRNHIKLQLYIDGLNLLKSFYKMLPDDNSISFEKASYNEYDNPDSGKFVDWTSDKGQGINDFLEGDTVYFVDDDIKNFKIIHDHFKINKSKKVVLFIMTHFIESKDPKKLHIYDYKKDELTKHSGKNTIQFYHISDFTQLADHIDLDMIKFSKHNNPAILYGGKK
jgi:hypothetical protein